MLVLPGSAPRGVPIPRLAELRLSRALSQEMLAKRAGVGRATIARIESGDVARFLTVHKLAAALELEAAELLRRDA